MIWKVKGEGQPVLQVFEDFYGNLWFVTEKIPDTKLCFGYVRLYSMPQLAEWGEFYDLAGLRKELGQNQVWEVNKKNWRNINTYEKGLLIETVPNPGFG